MQHMKKVLLLCFLTMLLAACPLIRGTGNTVQAVGEGVGDAVTGTGQAIGQTGRELASDPMR